MTVAGHSRPGRANSKSGHGRDATESGRNFRVVERFFDKINLCRRTATCYDKRAANDLAFVRLAAIRIRPGAYEPRWFMQDQHMNPSDAVKALADCGAQAALAHHHGTFQLTDEAIDAPIAALAEAKIPRERFVAVKPGQVFEIEGAYS